MATLIVRCKNCQKEVTSTIDLSAPAAKEIIDKGLKEGVICEACAVEYNCSTSESYLGIPVTVPRFIMDAYIDTIRKALESPPYLVEYDPKDPGNVEFIAGKPGTKLQVRRLHPLEIYKDPNEEEK